MNFSKNTNTTINNMGVTSTYATSISPILSTVNNANTLQVDNSGNIVYADTDTSISINKQEKNTNDVKKELNKKYGLPKCYEPIIHIIEEMNELNAPYSSALLNISSNHSWPIYICLAASSASPNVVVHCCVPSLNVLRDASPLD